MDARLLLTAIAVCAAMAVSGYPACRIIESTIMMVGIVVAE
jgi:hypothetical protein